MRKLASVQKISDIQPIQGADKIEVATVLGWKTVVPKGQYKPGDEIIYCEIDSMIPRRPWSEFLFKDMYQTRYRLKTKKLKGQLSQGIIFPKTILKEDKPIGTDVTKELDIKLYIPHMPAKLRGDIKSSFPSFIPKTDAIRLQSIPDILNELDNVKLAITEKIDGTSSTFYRHGEFGVCSRNFELKKQDTAYWRIAEKYNMEKIIPDGFAIQGEIYGNGIQKNPLKQTDFDLAVFNVFDIKAGQYLKFEDMMNFCASHKLPTVPYIGYIKSNKYTLDFFLNNSKGYSIINTECLKEGIVVRDFENSYSQVLNSRIFFKVINNDYLENNKY